MEYKLHPKFRGEEKYKLSVEPNRRSELVSSKILAVEQVSAEPRKRTKFDLTVPGTHTYLVDGCAVHNSPETTTGGNALKFYSSVRLDIRRIGGIKKGEVHIGNKLRIKTVKNKMAPPFQECEPELYFSRGIDPWYDLLDLAVKYDVVGKSGSWYSFGDERIGQGRENAVEYLMTKDNDTGKTLVWLRKKVEDARNALNADAEVEDSND